MNKGDGPCESGDLSLQDVDGVRQLAVGEAWFLDWDDGVLGYLVAGGQEREHGIGRVGLEAVLACTHRSTKSAVVM